MSTIITLLTLFLTSPNDVEALRKTAPSYLTTESAAEHLVAARIAAATYNVDADLLLSTAYYESRYTVSAVGPVVQGKTACGVMQPLMKQGCAPQTLLEGYLEGAKHLATWYQACRGNERCALLGYGGGYALIKKCGEGPLMVERGGRQVDLCTLDTIRRGRAQWIRRTRDKLNAS